jgi:hypothetical protein
MAKNKFSFGVRFHQQSVRLFCHYWFSRATYYLHVNKDLLNNCILYMFRYLINTWINNVCEVEFAT